MKKYFLLTLLLTTVTLLKAQTNTYKVFAVRFAASSYPFKVGDWAKGGPINKPVNINFMYWLLKGANGKNILVDAGFLNDTEEAKEFQLVNYIRPDSALLKTGLKATDITDIILSHPHWDHVDGISLFPNARVWMQKEDYNGVVGTAWQKPGESGGFDKRDVRLLVELNLAGRLKLVNGDNREIIPGVTVFTGSKHTFNSQYVRVQAGTNRVILASDNIWIYYNLEHMVPASTGGTLDPAGYVKAMQRMKTLASSPKYIIPGHDGDVFTRFPAVADGVVEIR
jgi:glyoxylase-like metal-dependent hydrolase (beta-lactamase superfamily II)